MQRTISAHLDSPASRVFAVLEDLGTYPGWLDIVTRSDRAPAAPSDTGPAWFVTLRARIGPLARAKRLRMVRTISEPSDRLRFQRAEVDGRTHSAWILDVVIEGSEPADVTVEFRYEGRFWSAPLGAILGAQADSAVPRLQALVAS